MRLHTYRKSSSFHISALSPLPFTSRVSYTSDKTRRIVAKSLFTQWLRWQEKEKRDTTKKCFKCEQTRSRKKSHTSYKLCSINNTRTRDMRAGIHSCVRLDTHSTSFIFILLWFFLLISTELAKRRGENLSTDGFCRSFGAVAAAVAVWEKRAERDWEKSTNKICLF